MKSDSEMVKGYIAGFTSHLKAPPLICNWSVSYKHGWLNGRDDRLGKPRSSASILRKRADLILNNVKDLK